MFRKSVPAIEQQTPVRSCRGARGWSPELRYLRLDAWIARSVCLCKFDLQTEYGLTYCLQTDRQRKQAGRLPLEGSISWEVD